MLLLLLLLVRWGRRRRLVLVLHAMHLVEFVLRGLGAQVVDHHLSARYRLLASGNGHRPAFKRGEDEGGGVRGKGGQGRGKNL